MRLKDIDFKTADIVSPKEAAKIIDICRSKLEYFRKVGVIPYVKYPDQSYRIGYIREHCKRLQKMLELDLGRHENPFKSGRLRKYGNYFHKTEMPEDI